MKILKKHIIIFFAAIMVALALGHSQDAKAQDTAFNMRLKQRNAADNGDVDRYIAPPAPGSNCLFYFNGSTILPTCASIGAGLSLTDGTLSSTAGAAQVNSDWTATSGVARILNKPNIATVGMTGQYADLLGAPAFATVATTGAYTDLSGKPVLAKVATTGIYSDLSGRPSLATVATTGSYNDLTDKPAAPAAYVFNFGEPAARSISMSTAYQALDPSRAAIITASASCTAALSLTAGGTCTLQIRTSATAGLTCSSGTLYGTTMNANTGTLTVGLGLNQRVGSATTINLRAGSWFILCPQSGTFTVDGVVDQSIG